MGIIDRNKVPFIAVDAVVIGIDHNIESADLVGSGRRLNYRNSVYGRRLFKKSVAVTADDNVNSPVRIKKFRKLFVFFKTDMGKKNGEVDIVGFMSIADFSDFGCCFTNVNKGTDQSVLLRLGKNLFGKDSDEHDLHTVDFFYVMGFKKTDAGCCKIKVCVNDGESCAFFKEEKMSNSVISFMVAEGDNVRSKHVHDFYGGHAFIFAVDYASAEHVTGNGVKNVFLLFADLVEISRKHRNAANKLFVLFLRHKVAVHII